MNLVTCSAGGPLLSPPFPASCVGSLTKLVSDKPSLDSCSCYRPHACLLSRCLAELYSFYNDPYLLICHALFLSPRAILRISGLFRRDITGEENIQSVIQQPSQPSVIQSTALQTVQISKGNVILLKQPPNSVIQSAGGGNLPAVQVLDAGEEQDSSRKRQILARRPSYRKILNELGGGEISDKGDAGSSDSSQDEPTGTVTIGGQQYQTAVIPAGSLQLSGQGSDGLQTIAMTNAATAGGAIVQYAQGSDPQFIVPVATSDLSGLKIATSTGAGGLTQGVVLATESSVHRGDQMAEEATRKREIRLMKNREAARECRAKKKEYIKCLENRVAVLENQNKALIEELKTLKALYCQNS
ncbi:cyclic AMP-dependent transcription factor ATF-1 isoform X3 [Macrobrachium rosenbergii]|uniref:cyclic AMP-dependent transcription factor ATF-1 isoform X3 n=1 Tax=Macrobrachium rosenbergii TaxID=79674 RepID=UPI0034D58EA8